VGEPQPGMRSGYTFAGQHFPRKQDVVAAIQAILHHYPYGQPISQAHLQFMMAVLEDHPSADIKIGCGVARMEVRPNMRFPSNRYFWIIRHDGTGTDFSFMQCLKPATHAQKVRSAFREAISDQLANFKRQEFPRHQDATGHITCPILKILVTWEDVHVDHQRPTTLVALVDAFLAAKQLRADDIAVIGSADGMLGNRLQDATLTQEWAAYHRVHAKLRMVSKQANLGTLRRTGFEDKE
jgi:hypothetical protein